MAQTLGSPRFHASKVRTSVSPSSRSVFARAWRIPVSSGLTTTTRRTFDNPDERQAALERATLRLIKES